jgi:hypothetical protein
MKRLDHRPDITVLENRVPRLASSAHDNIDHRSGQVVGPNNLVREERSKHGVDRAHQPVAEIRFVQRIETKVGRFREGFGQSRIESPQRFDPAQAALTEPISYCPQIFPASSQTIVKFTWGPFKSSIFGTIVCDRQHVRCQRTIQHT